MLDVMLAWSWDSGDWRRRWALALWEPGGRDCGVAFTLTLTLVDVGVGRDVTRYA